MAAAEWLNLDDLSSKWSSSRELREDLSYSSERACPERANSRHMYRAKALRVYTQQILERGRDWMCTRSSKVISKTSARMPEYDDSQVLGKSAASTPIEAWVTPTQHVGSFGDCRGQGPRCLRDRPRAGRFVG